MTEAGVRRKAYLFAILDDHSRLITHARFYLNENKASLKDLETSIEDLKHSAQLCLPQEDAPPAELFPKSPTNEQLKDIF